MTGLGSDLILIRFGQAGRCFNIVENVCERIGGADQLAIFIGKGIYAASLRQQKPAPVFALPIEPNRAGLNPNHTPSSPAMASRKASPYLIDLINFCSAEPSH